MADFLLYSRKDAKFIDWPEKIIQNLESFLHNGKTLSLSDWYQSTKKAHNLFRTNLRNNVSLPVNYR